MATLATAFEGSQAVGSETSSAQQAQAAETGGETNAQNQLTGGLSNANNALNTDYGVANNLLTSFTNQATGQLTPYQATGTAANTQLSNLLGYGSAGAGGMESTLENTPGYQFALTQGLKAAQNNATSTGLGVSGSALKGAEQYATGLADQTYQQQVGDTYNAANMGLNAATNSAGIYAQTGGNLYNGTNALGTNLSNNYLTAATQGANYNNELGQSLAGQYNLIGNANATADYAGAQSAQQDQKELLSMYSSGGFSGGGKGSK
jgi:hypothetical protein